MAQTPYTEQDAWSLADKLTQFTQTLTPGEQAAFEALERHVSGLVPVDDVNDVHGFAFAPDSIVALGQARAQELRDEAAQIRQANEASSGTAGNRTGLWYRLVTGLNPPQRG